MRVTDPCPACGHQIIAHSAVDGCTFCECSKKHIAIPAGDHLGRSPLAPLDAATVYLVTVVDYDEATLIGAYTTEKQARAVAAAVNVIDHGRFGPYVIPVVLDQDPAIPVSLDHE